MSNREIYFSIDIEANGPVPGPYSMLSFAAVAFRFVNKEIELLGDISYNLETLAGAKVHEDTMCFWAKFPEAYRKTRENQVNPSLAMNSFIYWIKRISKDKTPIFVGYPAVYDFKWIDYYFHVFLGRNPFGFSAIDMKSFAYAKLGFNNFTSVNKRSMPNSWFKPSLAHTHVALDDALEQAHIFAGMKYEK